MNNSTQEARKVYIVNRSCHDFSSAAEFGELVYLTDGVISRYAVSEVYRTFADGLAESQAGDFILISGMSTMIAVICALFGAKHQRLNLLLYKKGRYLERTIII